MSYMNTFIFISMGAAAFIVFIAAIVIFWRTWDKTYETPRDRAGKQGERKAAEIIRQVLREEDVFLTNVHINYKGKITELDNVIINGSGVFIIEVKNYRGVLTGGEEDYEWTKYKISRGGNTYEKKVRNPIKQVKRQVYILSRFLKYYGMNVWIDGYVLFINNNSPIHSNMVLESFKEIDQAVHRRPGSRLSKQKVHRIKELLL